MVATGYVSASGDPSKLPLAGGTMTGDLVLSDDTPDTGHSAASKDYVLGVAGGGAIPASTVNAKGDLLVATADNTVTRLGVGANGTVLTAASGETEGVEWAALAGGSGATVTSGYVVTGDVTLPNVGSTWTAVTGLTGFTIPAVAGDRITFQPSFLADLAGANFLDVAVVGAASAFVRVASNGATGTPATPAVEGDPTAYREANNELVRGLGPFTFVAGAADIVGGNVSFSVIHKGTGTTSTVYASTNYPFRWTARNDGQ